MDTLGMETDDLPPPGFPDHEWAAASPFMRQAVSALLTVVAQLQQEIATLRHDQDALRQQVVDLTTRLNQHSQNSSKPPSSDPPSAPPRPPRVPRGRKAGGQAGHPRHDRPEPEPEQITTTRHHYPSACPTCGDTLT